jgi:hypothetical protein
MFDCTPTLRRLAAVGTAVVAMASAAPLASAASHRPGEGLSGSDRAWLKPQSVPRHLGEGLNGTDRSWLIHTSVGGHGALPSDGFDWADAGIGAGTVVAALFFITGSTIVIRRRFSTAH